MKYLAALTNTKPPGEILNKGSFGPWVAEDPGDAFWTAIMISTKPISACLPASRERFIPRAISAAHFLHSTLRDRRPSKLRVEAIRNPVPLTTRFQVHVDGTNGDTILKPVIGTTGTTTFTTSGTVIKNYSANRRTIHLEVTMPKGDLRDLLRLAMKGPPFMEGQITLKTKIDIPPLSGRFEKSFFWTEHSKLPEESSLNPIFRIRSIR
jgi:hypothetical protein